MNGLTCGIVRDLLPLYCDGVCGEESRVGVKKHLDSCPACREEYEKMKGELVPPPLAREENRREGTGIAAFERHVETVRRKSLMWGVCGGLIAAALLSVVSFYLFPLWIADTGSGMFVLLLLIPAACFCGGLLYGLFAGVRWLFPLGVAAMFLPAILLYFNSSALIYSPLFGGVALAGNLLGGLIRRLTRK